MAMRVERRGGTRGCQALGRSAVARAWTQQPRLLPNTPAYPLESTARLGKFCGKQPIPSPKIAFTSRMAAMCVRRSGPMRKNIIGHAMSVLRQHLGDGAACLQVQRSLRLLHQPARGHGRRVFLHPLVKKRGNFLAEIGGVAETRELEALERDSRSRAQKFPGGLRLGSGHMGLLGDTDTLTVG